MNKGLWVLTMLNTFVVCPLLILIQLGYCKYADTNINILYQINNYF